MSSARLPCRVKKGASWRDAIIVERYWIQAQGWFAVIEDDGRGMLGMQGTTQVPLEAVRPLAGMDYSCSNRAGTCGVRRATCHRITRPTPNGG
jgi:hypothetical protein